MVNGCIHVACFLSTSFLYCKQPQVNCLSGEKASLLCRIHLVLFCSLHVCLDFVAILLFAVHVALVLQGQLLEREAQQVASCVIACVIVSNPSQ